MTLAEFLGREEAREERKASMDPMNEAVAVECR